MIISDSRNDGPERAAISLDRSWAKHDAASGSSHPLHAHLADVAAVLEVLLDRTPLGLRLAAAMGVATLSPRQRASLVYLAAVHDAGKVNHGFQEQIGSTPRLPRRNHHSFFLASLAVDAVADAAFELVRPLGLGERDALELFRTTVAHHGVPIDALPDPGAGAFWKPLPRVRDPLGEMRELGTLALRASGLAEAPGPPLVVTPALTHLFAGALTLADWIGSTESLFPFAPDAEPATYWDEARTRAEEACLGVGAAALPVVLRAHGADLLPRLFPAVFSGATERAATSLQARVASMPLPAPGTRLLIESETGSGKTEAALVLYARLREAGVVGGLVFALPTRATASAMYARITAAAAAMYGQTAPAIVLAVGGDQPRTGGSAALAEAPRVDEAEDGPGPDPARGWASERAKRFLAGEIVVGTLDQVLLGALHVRHAHMRLAALTRHLLVVDELHSYDRYMTGVLAALLEMHTAHGGVALFMSATLSDAARRTFGGDGAPVTLATAVARAYPALATCERGGAWRDEHLPSASAPKRVRWTACGLDEGLARAVADAREGARVCILRNTVRGAREAVIALREGGHEALLWSPRAGATPAYHSRYAPPDRLALDEAVLTSFGRGGTASGVILVATQVAEQSLDVDFDLLVTDLCPVDVLLQRIGRLWRHPERRRPPASTTAAALVIAPEDGFAAYLDTRMRAGPNGWGSVYPDLGDLELTLRRVRQEPGIEIPRDNRRLVESVYHEDARASLTGEGWETYRIDREGKEFASVTHARQSTIRFAAPYSACARDFVLAAEARIRTRLGDDRVRVMLDSPLQCRYVDGAVDFVDLPEEEVMRAGASGLIARSDATGSFTLGALRLAYDDDGWTWRREHT